MTQTRDTLSATTATPPSPVGAARLAGNGHRVPQAETPRRITQFVTGETWWERWKLAIAAVGAWTFLAVGLLAEHVFELPNTYSVGAYVLAYISGGAFATVAALADLRQRTVNVDLLMVTAAIGAAIVGHWEEGAILLGLFSTSNALEHYALERTQRAVRSLMELSPAEASLVDASVPGGERLVPVQSLRVGDIVLVRPGERIAVDGKVITGESAVDQSAITGESVPVDKAPGDSVFAATINTTGALRLEVTRISSESTLAKIIQFVTEAREQKSRTQRFTDRFEGRYTILVLTVSALAAIVPPVLLGSDWYDSFYRAMTLLVVASPCALVISTPAATLSGLANAARNGILFKGGGYLEDAGLVEIVAFDKTGTLTEGKPRVTDVIDCSGGWSETEVLQRAASAEKMSQHPLALAVVAAAGKRGLLLAESTEFQSVTGRGLVARVDGHTVVIGNEAHFHDLGVVPGAAGAIAAELRAQGKTAVLVGGTEQVQGVIALADTLRPTAAGVVCDLKELGVTRTVMLTGDNKQVAQAIAQSVGIDEVRADLLPEEKLKVIQELKQDGPVAMVGDGVNDAPALATATVGVAMGGAGTDVALETADIVLMADDLTRLPYAISLGRRTRRIILQNLGFSLTVIVVLVTAAVTVGIPLPLGVVGHEGSTIIVVLNGLRLLRT